MIRNRLTKLEKAVGELSSAARCPACGCGCDGDGGPWRLLFGERDPAPGPCPVCGVTPPAMRIVFPKLPPGCGFDAEEALARLRQY